jgi:RHS repeat-associated protein
MFTGRRFDVETGLYYYRARYYNPYIGRFLQTDPVGYGDGINWYMYCKNNPLSLTDPSGTSALFDVGRITYILAGDANEYYLKVHNAEEFIEWLEGLRDAGERITFFEFVGHGETPPPEKNDAVGLTMGNDVFGIGETEIDVNRDGIDDWYGINDYASLLQAVFYDDPDDPCDTVVIELEACYSAGSIGKAFKSILPDAHVWGYTGKCIPIPFTWETFRDIGVDWVEVKI